MSKASRSSCIASPAATPVLSAPAAAIGIAAPALTSIVDLGRRLAALATEADRLDEANVTAEGKASIKLDAALNVVCDQCDAIHALIRSMPAATLADAAVQIASAIAIAGEVSGFHHTREELGTLARKLERTLLSALPFVAAAADLDVCTMRWDWLVQLRAHRFAGLEFSA